LLKKLEYSRSLVKKKNSQILKVEKNLIKLMTYKDLQVPPSNLTVNVGNDKKIISK